jgi:hypothetical protein
MLTAQACRLYPAPQHVVIDHYRRFQRAAVVCRREGWDSIETLVRA